MTKRLFVGNLSYDTTDQTLIAAFEKAGGKVASVHVMTDRDTGRPRGFAFVEMETDEDARRAIEAMNGAEVDGRSLRVNEAQARQPRAGGGGGGGGGGGYGRPRQDRPGGGGGGRAGFARGDGGRGDAGRHGDDDRARGDRRGGKRNRDDFDDKRRDDDEGW